MANFTIRVELINHKDPEDYNTLHQEMYNKAFYRVVKLDNIWHDLPTAEYSKNSSSTIHQIYNEVKACADKATNASSELSKDYYILATKADGVRIAKLKKATDSKKLPPGEKL